MIKNIFYFKNICPIGGTEQFLYEISKMFSKDFEIAILYDQADTKQIQRLNEYVQCIPHVKGKKIVCERAFFNFNIDAIDDIESTENYYCFVAHASFEFYGYHPPINNPKINHYIGVSKWACEKLEEYARKFMNMEIKCELAYNPLVLEPKEKVVHLVSACRFNDKVKGGERTKILIKALDKYCEENNRHYLWTIFTYEHNNPEITSKNVVYMKPRTDVRAFIQDSDFVLQLSNDMETYCYTLNEAWEYGVHTISTPLSVLSELPVPKSANYLLDYDCSNVEAVVKHIFEDKLSDFVYKSPKSEWKKYLSPGKTVEKYVKLKKLKVSATENVLYGGGITISEFDGKPNPGDEAIILENRFETLGTNNNITGKPLVKLIEYVD